MLESLYLLLGCAAIWYILYWSIRNDKAKSIKDQTGLIRMKCEEGPDSNGPKKAKWRPKSRRADVSGR